MRNNLIGGFCLVVILGGCLALKTTWDEMEEKRLLADWDTPTNWYTGADCEPLAKAIPDAKIDERGWIYLPARTIVLTQPICECSYGRWCQLEDKTILVLP
jgi:hypothetical protein